jgi:hypothetical protein
MAGPDFDAFNCLFVALPEWVGDRRLLAGHGSNGPRFAEIDAAVEHVPGAAEPPPTVKVRKVPAKPVKPREPKAPAAWEPTTAAEIAEAARLQAALDAFAARCRGQSPGRSPRRNCDQTQRNHCRNRGETSRYRGRNYYRDGNTQRNQYRNRGETY